MSDTGFDAFFRRDADVYVGNDAARGPWAADACHAGPVTGVIAGELEAVLPDKQLTRITVNYLRPVPVTGFRVAAEVSRDRRTAAYTRAKLFDAESRLCAEAEGLHLKTRDIGPVSPSGIAAPVLSEATPGRFPVMRALHDLPFFGDAVEIAYPPGETTEPGPTTLWMRAPAIVAGEQSSPFQRLCALADCGNGISRNAEFGQVSCINPDLTIAVHRLPASEWLASAAVSFWEPTGLGTTRATLFDTEGPIGTAVQTLVLAPM